MGNFLFNPDLGPETHNAFLKMNRRQRRALGYHTRRYAADRHSPKKTNRRFERMRYYAALMAELED